MSKKYTISYSENNLPKDNTDWKKTDNLADDTIDTSDIPELGEGFWKDAEIVLPKTKNHHQTDKN